MKTLKDKTAVITGAGSGIGRSIALALADDDYASLRTAGCPENFLRPALRTAAGAGRGALPRTLAGFFALGLDISVK